MMQNQAARQGLQSFIRNDGHGFSRWEFSLTNTNKNSKQTRVAPESAGNALKGGILQA